MSGEEKETQPKIVYSEKLQIPELEWKEAADVKALRCPKCGSGLVLTIVGLGAAFGQCLKCEKMFRGQEKK